MGVQEGDGRNDSANEAREPSVAAEARKPLADHPDPSAAAETTGGSTASEPPVAQPTGGSADPQQTGGDPAAQLAAALAQRDEYLDLARRTQADFENFRKRAAREVAETRARAVADVVRELLPAIDNLERALDAVEGAAAAENDQLASGVKLVHDELHGVLERLGLSVVDPSGDPFDPNVHDAISTRPAEGTAAGTVVDVAQKGYLLGDTVVRPARVVVSS